MTPTPFECVGFPGVGIPVGIAIMRCGNLDVIVDVAAPFINRDGQIITCNTGPARGPQIFLSGKDHNIQRPATGDEVAAAEMIMAKAAALDGSMVASPTAGILFDKTATTQSKAPGEVLGASTLPNDSQDVLMLPLSHTYSGTVVNAASSVGTSTAADGQAASDGRAFVSGEERSHTFQVFSSTLCVVVVSLLRCRM